MVYEDVMVGTQLGFDAVLDLCGDKHRRIVLAVLAGQQRTLTIDDLAKAVVKHNHHTPLREVPGEEMVQIKSSLHHAHVPELEASGLVEYDIDRHLVEPTAQFERTEPHLSAILDADPEIETPLAL